MKILTIYKLEPHDPPWRKLFDEQFNLCLFTVHRDPDIFAGNMKLINRMFTNAEFTLDDRLQFGAWVERVIRNGRGIIQDMDIAVPQEYYENWKQAIDRLEQLLHRFTDWFNAEVNKGP